jgi:diguanylate cyclase (GGDEF)-like protein
MMSVVTGRPKPGSRFLALLGESRDPRDGSSHGGLLESSLVRLLLAAVLLASAAAILTLTNSQGLVTVLVLIAACATATWFGRWAGAGVASAAGGMFIAANITMERTSGVAGVAFTLVAVCMWVFLAWAAGVTADERRRMNDLLVHRALHDPLTGLANRTLLTNRLEQALRRGERHGSPVAVIFLDLDDFKSVNDTMGHAAGDKLLAQLGERFAERLRASDTAARIGGDEFAFVCEDLHDQEEAKGIVARLMQALDEPYRHQGRAVPIRASVGVAVTSSFAQNAEQLLREADQAMYRAKRRGAQGSETEGRSNEFPLPRDPRGQEERSSGKTSTSHHPR